MGVDGGVQRADEVVDVLAHDFGAGELKAVLERGGLKGDAHTLRYGVVHTPSAARRASDALVTAVEQSLRSGELSAARCVQLLDRAWAEHAALHRALLPLIDLAEPGEQPQDQAADCAWTSDVAQYYALSSHPSLVGSLMALKPLNNRLATILIQRLAEFSQDDLQHEDDLEHDSHLHAPERSSAQAGNGGLFTFQRSIPKLILGHLHWVDTTPHGLGQTEALNEVAGLPNAQSQSAHPLLDDYFAVLSACSLGIQRDMIAKLPEFMCAGSEPFVLDALAGLFSENRALAAVILETLAFVRMDAARLHLWVDDYAMRLLPLADQHVIPALLQFIFRKQHACSGSIPITRTLQQCRLLFDASGLDRSTCGLVVDSLKQTFASRLDTATSVARALRGVCISGDLETGRTRELDIWIYLSLAQAAMSCSSSSSTLARTKRTRPAKRAGGSAGSGGFSCSALSVISIETDVHRLIEHHAQLDVRCADAAVKTWVRALALLRESAVDMSCSVRLLISCIRNSAVPRARRSACTVLVELFVTSPDVEMDMNASTVLDMLPLQRLILSELVAMVTAASSSPASINSALLCLLRITLRCRASRSLHIQHAIANCRAFIDAILDCMERFSSWQTRVVYTVFYLAYSGVSSEPERCTSATSQNVLDPTLNILIRKQLCHTHREYQRIGIIGGVTVAKLLCLQEHHNGEEEEHQQQLLQPANQAAVLQKAEEILKLLRSVAHSHVDNARLLYDELGAAFCARTMRADLLRKVVKRLSADINRMFLRPIQGVDSESTLNPNEPAKVHEQPNLWGNIDQLEAGFYVPILEFCGSAAEQDRAAIQTLCSLMGAIVQGTLATCHNSLASLDGVLGAPLELPAALGTDQYAVDKFGALPASAQLPIALATFTAINWIRQCLNAFGDQDSADSPCQAESQRAETREFRKKCLVRLVHLVKLHRALEHFVRCAPELGDALCVYTSQVSSSSDEHYLFKLLGNHVNAPVGGGRGASLSLARLAQCVVPLEISAIQILVDIENVKMYSILDDPSDFALVGDACLLLLREFLRCVRDVSGVASMIEEIGLYQPGDPNAGVRADACRNAGDAVVWLPRGYMQRYSPRAFEAPVRAVCHLVRRSLLHYCATQSNGTGAASCVEDEEAAHDNTDSQNAGPFIMQDVIPSLLVMCDVVVNAVKQSRAELLVVVGKEEETAGPDADDIRTCVWPLGIGSEPTGSDTFCARALELMVRAEPSCDFRAACAVLRIVDTLRPPRRASDQQNGLHVQAGHRQMLDDKILCMLVEKTLVKPDCSSRAAAAASAARLSPLCPKEPHEKCVFDLLKIYERCSESRFGALRNLLEAARLGLADAERDGQTNRIDGAPFLFAAREGTVDLLVQFILSACAEHVGGCQTLSAQVSVAEKEDDHSSSLLVLVAILHDALMLARERETLWGSSLKAGRRFVEAVSKVHMGVLGETLQQHHNQRKQDKAAAVGYILELLKKLQKITRFLQRLAVHVKGGNAGSDSLAKIVPELRKALELFIYDVKIMFERLQALQSLSIGNLKHRDIYGHDLPSSQLLAPESEESEESVEDDEEEEEEEEDNDNEERHEDDEEQPDIDEQNELGATMVDEDSDGGVRAGELGFKNWSSGEQENLAPNDEHEITHPLQRSQKRSRRHYSDANSSGFPHKRSPEY